jgi:ataxia telangiectasia mutated family protein
MSKASNLNAVLHDLKSDKVKERQQGIVSLRTVFARDSVVLTLDESGKGQAWLSVFQALYTTVGIEKAASTKKGPSSKATGAGAAAFRRLGDAAATVRWLTERSVQRMNKAVVKSLFSHLIQTMVYNGELLAPVALDYIKTMRCLVSWTPHMDHLNEDTWIRMVEMAFNVILGDPVKRILDEDGEYDEGEASTVPGTELDDSEFLMDDEPDGDVDENIPSTSTAVKPQKRRRDHSPASRSSPANRPSTSRHRYKSKAPRAVSLEQIEFTSLLAILLQSPSAPLLSPHSPHLASAIVRRLQRFLDLYPADTSLHHDYILSLSATLSHIALNRKHEVETFAHGAWDGLLGLWGTKNKAMKEGLVAILRALFPYFTTEPEDSYATFGWADGVGRLSQLLDGEAESRWGVDGLSFDSLRLKIASNDNDDRDAGELPAFVAQTFQAGWHFDAGQALAWAILELQADCTEKVISAITCSDRT